MAHAVAEAVSRAGGRTFFVGGYVRDKLLGRDNKDIDIEVHGVAVETLEEILDSLGQRMTMGASFGVMGLRHFDLDIAMPRSETATGRGHKDFAVFVDPFLGVEKAARRRDFTVNALMQDVLTGEILDFFGGREDMDKRILRHVDDRSFGEDPLRVFRAAQLAARFGFSAAEETVKLASRMDVDALPTERVMGELEKALLKSEKPSVFFEELRRMGKLEPWFAELAALTDDGRTNAMGLVDASAAQKDRASDPMRFMLAALCLRLGARGEAERFLRRLTKETALTRYVLNMVQLHSQPGDLARRGAGAEEYMTMFDRSLCPTDLLLLAKAEFLVGLRPGTAEEEAEVSYAETEGRHREMLAVYDERMSRPYVRGRDLIEAGLEPGPVFSEALSYAHRLRLAGRPKEEQLKRTLAYIRNK